MVSALSTTSLRRAPGAHAWSRESPASAGASAPTPDPHEEAIHPPPPEGPGYAPLHIGATLDQGKYEIVRKLGWGTGSTVWLARRRASDQTPRYVAIKVLTQRSTGEVTDHHTPEQIVLEGLKRLFHKSQGDPNKYPGLQYCLIPTDIFIEQGKHRCFVARPCAENVRMLRSRYTLQQFSLPVIKSVVRQTLRALALLHGGWDSGHLDVKWDNVFVDLPANADEAITKFLRENPPQTFPQLPGQELATTVSQPLSISAFGVRLQDIRVRLGDFGSTAPIPPTDCWHVDSIPTPVLLRPPELYSSGYCSIAADVWALGCMVYELLIPSPPLFLPERSTEGAYRPEDIVRRFDVRLALAQPLEDPGPASVNTLDNANLETLVRNNPDIRANLSEPDIAATCAFIRRCLTVEPKDRPTVGILLQDGWLNA